MNYFLRGVTFLLPLAVLVHPTFLTDARQPDLSRCQPIGRIINSRNPKLPTGSLVCAEQIIASAKFTQSTTLLCWNGTILTAKNLNASTIERSCSATSKDPMRLCSSDQDSFCIRPRGSSPIALRFLSPIGYTIIDTRPQLAWTPIDRAQKYTVQIRGNDLAYQTTTVKPSLVYPAQLASLTPGNTYQVTISTTKNSERLTVRTVIRVLDREQTQILNRTIAQIRQLNLSPDEQALDLARVYAAKNLIHNAIQVLEARVRSGSQDSRVQATLTQLLKLS
ncbi:hypothetical protein ACQ4M3_05730 [Leptolyngbya sp. AN03gr2]|uniref:hypothetical protein n=1 Tax=unclassified Leptolyngbya TaxID=2650499 RepID=UPI003D321CD2